MDLILSANSNDKPLDDGMIEALKKLGSCSCLAPDGSEIPLLTAPELEAITIKNGTLTDKERKVMQQHVTGTANMLKEMDFRGIYEKVPEWAGAHHELLNGSGYPSHMKGDEISPQTRLITIIDIYDAMTADDRPYNHSISPEDAFTRLDDDCKAGKLDKELLYLFKESRAWDKPV